MEMKNFHFGLRSKSSTRKKKQKQKTFKKWFVLIELTDETRTAQIHTTTYCSMMQKCFGPKMECNKRIEKSMPTRHFRTLKHRTGPGNKNAIFTLNFWYFQFRQDNNNNNNTIDDDAKKYI